MSSVKVQLIERLEVHMIIQILRSSSTVQQLFNTIKSHRIFNNVFKQSPESYRQSILRSVFLAQVPEHIVPYAIASLESRRFDREKVDARAEEEGVEAYTKVDKYIGQSVRAQEAPFEIFLRWEEERDTSTSCPTALMADYASMCWEYTAVATLRQTMANEILPLLTGYGLKHPGTLSRDESFRFDRAFLWYQIACNLHVAEPPEPDPYAEEDYSFYRPGPSYATAHRVTEQGWTPETWCSPWVEDQQKAVYHFLNRKVTYVVSEFVGHDVDFAANGLMAAKNEEQYYGRNDGGDPGHRLVGWIVSIFEVKG
ncbi:hypothetical protein H9Q69_013837 [Fusarium xylarioides]|nr:hypothetical protein H9Q70_006283 [Fusarium xylarioides]KAG5780001.1 hypothetical protein H9Q73_006311 [Fusarium xylarioides]KAG5787091.1 hypothetical protein H9Q69_013837 [Fusarium xylarioides]